MLVACGSVLLAADEVEPLPPALQALPVVDLDRYRVLGTPLGGAGIAPLGEVSGTPLGDAGDWTWQFLPAGLIYESYLASTKESRLAGYLLNARHDGWLFDGAVGARVGVLRFGDQRPAHADGWQVDVEGAAQLRLDVPNEVDLRSVDYRAGVPVSFGCGRHRVRLGYYHLSSHLGDEFLLDNPGYPRLNFARDVLFLGHTLYWTARLRTYAEVGWAFYADVSEPWEFQLGVDYGPMQTTTLRGEPFWAVNGHLREEVDFGGGLAVQGGWAWRNERGELLRVGLHYYNGPSNQFSFFREHEEQFGVGIWYDF